MLQELAVVSSVSRARCTPAKVPPCHSLQSVGHIRGRLLAWVLLELVNHRSQVRGELCVVPLVLSGALRSEKGKYHVSTFEIGLLASKISTMPRNPPTADLRGGNTSELFSNRRSAAFSPDHASFPAFFAATVRLDSAVDGCSPSPAEGEVVGAGSLGVDSVWGGPCGC
jgi:hypothetical protein